MRQAAAVFITSTPTPASVSARKQAGRRKALHCARAQQQDFRHVGEQGFEVGLGQSREPKRRPSGMHGARREYQAASVLLGIHSYPAGAGSGDKLCDAGLDV